MLMLLKKCHKLLMLVRGEFWGRCCASSLKWIQSWLLGYRVINYFIVFEPGPHKLDMQRKGPYEVHKKVTNVTYIISMPDHRKKTLIFHVNGMRAWQEPASGQYCQEQKSAVWSWCHDIYMSCFSAWQGQKHAPMSYKASPSGCQ